MGTEGLWGAALECHIESGQESPRASPAACKQEAAEAKSGRDHRDQGTEENRLTCPRS